MKLFEDGHILVVTDDNSNVELRQISALDSDVEYETLDTFGVPSTFYLSEPEESNPNNTYVVRSMVGMSQLFDGSAEMIVKQGGTHEIFRLTVRDMSEVDFSDGLYPAVLAPMKRTKLRDHAYFMDNLNQTRRGEHYISIGDEGDPTELMLKLSEAGITAHFNSEEYHIKVAHMQPICFPLKLFVGSMKDDFEGCVTIMRDLVARNILKPVYPFDRIHQEIQFISGNIYEGVNHMNYIPLMPIMKANISEGYDVHKLPKLREINFLKHQYRPMIQGSWFIF